jgi:tRNA-intron endonuclease
VSGWGTWPGVFLQDSTVLETPFREGLKRGEVIDAKMSAVLKDGEIEILEESEASQIYSKGYFGKPQSGGSLKLELIEGLYLVESGRLEVEAEGGSVDASMLIRLGHKQDSNFEIRYLVFRDLRKRGYVVKSGVGALDFRVYPRGGGPSSTPSKHWVIALSERMVFDLKGLIGLLDKASNARKSLLAAVVDEEGDLTYYRVSRVSPRGRSVRRRPKRPAEAIFLGDRVMILDPEDAARIHETEYFGRLIGSRLQLSLLETVFLMRRGDVSVVNGKTGRRISQTTFLKEAAKVQADFRMRLRVYEDLKERGIVVKTGFKYGSHFRAYKGDPGTNHAKYLVHAFPASYRGMWPEVSRAVRLAHGVKKDILFGRVGREIDYIRLYRIRP